MRKNKQKVGYPLNMLRQSAKRRLAILRKAQAVWSKRKIDPIKELTELRRIG